MELELDYNSDGNESLKSLDLFEEEGDDDLEFNEASSRQEGALHEATTNLRHSDKDGKTLTKNESTSCTSSSSIKSVHSIPNAAVSADDATATKCTPTLTPPISRIGLNAHKAGMEGLDKNKINQIILEASRGSKFYENEVRKERQVTEKINRMMSALKGLTSTQKLLALRAADKELERLEAGRDLSHIVVHVDMDAFYAAVETRDNPRLKDVPMAVGGNSMLSTSNYLARRYGVRAAMPGFIGKKLCPNLVIVKPNFSKYKQVSSEVQQILAEYDPEFCPMGLDESFLDLTDYVRTRISLVREEDCTMGHVCDAGEVPVADFGNPNEGIASAGSNSLCPGTSLKSEQETGVSCSKFNEDSAEHKQCLFADRTTASNVSLSSAVEPSTMTPEPQPVDRTDKNMTLLTLDSNIAVAMATSCSDCHSDQHRNETASEPGHGSEHQLPPSSTHPDFNPLQPGNETTPTLPSSHWEHAQTVVKEIRARIHDKTGLTASAGIAPNKMLAKVASDMNKPNGQFFVTPTRENVLQFVQSLPIRKISGIGKVTERLLNALGVTSCRDLYEHRAILQLLFSRISAHYFLRICLGIGSAEVHRDYERKSMSTERTFSELSDPADLQQKCRELCQALSEDMEKEGLKGRTVTLKLKTVFFEVKSRAVTLSRAVSNVEEICRPASELLRAEIKACGPAPLRLRLMGVRVSSLSGGGDRDRGTLERFLQQPDSGSGGGGRGGARSGSEGLIESGELEDDKMDPPDVSDQGLMAACPVCGLQVPANNATFNQHIDECLNHSAIQEVITTDPTPSTGIVNKSYSSPSKGSETKKLMDKTQAKSTSQSRKRKSVYRPKEESPIKKRTLDQFWK